MANHISHASLPYPIKNARYTVLVPYLDADGDPTDPTTPDTELSQDGGAFADAAEEMTTISGSNGMGFITISGAETNNSAVGGAAKVASGPKATLFTLYPRNLPILASGTASAGASGSLTLASSISYDITGCFVRTTGGTGGGGTGGANNQARRITAYNTGTQVATITPNWETTPDGTTTYDVLCPEGITIGMLKALNPATAGRTLVVDSAGLADANTVKLGPTGSGTAQTARDVGLSVLLSNGTGTGQLKLASGYVAMTWADIAAPTTTVALTGTTIAVTQKVDVDTIKTNPVVNGGTITFPTGATLASTTNITAGTITTVTTVTTCTTLTNLPAITAGWLTATGIAADAITAAKIADGAIDTATFAAGTTIPRCTLADTLTTYTGNTVQTGDSYARIGSNGAGLTAVVLGSTGLDSIATTAPSGVASNFREMVVQVWRRFFKKAVHDRGGQTLITYAEDGTTPITTQTLTDTSNVETQGTSS